LQGHGKIHLTTTFLMEVIEQSKDVLDDDAITDIIKSLNVIKNEKIQQSKRKSKGQAQKSKKADKVEMVKAQKVAAATFGDSNEYDVYDEIGDDFEDAFF
jgi:translation initiation factor 3 subunit J